jgi:peptidoglycan/LPS O-acetylase OafA/YrhL
MAPVESRGAELGYKPGLDGIRALAIIAVLLFHGGVGWASGGFLGVEAFFVLSGFLITSLLLSEWERRSGIGLGRFWARRARRLLPALFCLVAVVGVYQAVAGPSEAVPGLLGDGLATLAYVGNWHQIWTGAGYFAATAQPSPLTHTWSLAIEEQFYLVWPLVVLSILALARRRRSSSVERPNAGLKLLFAVAVAGALASAGEMALLFHAGSGLNRVYYGTDTRAQGLLAGAALACGLALWNRRDAAGDVPVAVRRLASSLGVVALGGILLGMHLAGASGGLGGGLYRGGFLAFDAASVCVIASVVLSPRGPAGLLLSTWPLRSIGQISYGLYLWHYPLFLWLTQASTGLAGAELLALRLGATLVVSVASFFAIEQPIRQRRWPTWFVRSISVPAVGGALAALLVASSVPAAALSGPGGPLGPSPAGPGGTDPVITMPTLPAGVPTTTVPAGPVSWAGSQPACKVLLPTTVPSYETSHTCPPVRVVMMGDSMAETLAFGLASNQQSYGVLMADDAQLGCSFGVKGPGDWSGTGFEGQYAPCTTQFETWHTEATAFHAQAVVVLMGYWDCFDREWNGQDVHLGQPAFDSYLYGRMVEFVHTEGSGGIPLVFLTVPWVDPPPFADGSPPPSASAPRHDEIKQMLYRLAAQFPGQVRVVDIDKWISPGNHFNSSVNGHACRWSDGIHFYDYCGALVAPHVMPLIRQLVEARGGPGPSGVVAQTKNHG